MPGFVQKQPQTLYEKVFNDHVVDEKEDGTVLIFIGTASRQYPTKLTFSRQTSCARSDVTCMYIVEVLFGTDMI
jgi:hypothetical protein